MEKLFLIVDKAYDTERQHAQLIFGTEENIKRVYKNCDVFPYALPTPDNSELKQQLAELKTQVESLTNEVAVLKQKAVV